MSKNAKKQLLDLIDHKVFDPILKASLDDYKSNSDKKKLKDLQKTTKSTQESYHKYKSAEKVEEMFRDDLHSDAAKDVHKESRSLHLPTLNEIKDEFEQLADSLGVGK